MNRIILQIWEESNFDDSIVSNGCSLHINEEERYKYLNKIYKDRELDKIPNTYDRIVGREVPVFVLDNIFKILEQEKTIKLSEIEFRNLLKLEKIIVNINII